MSARSVMARTGLVDFGQFWLAQIFVDELFINGETMVENILGIARFARFTNQFWRMRYGMRRLRQDHRRCCLTSENPASGSAFCCRPLGWRH